MTPAQPAALLTSWAFGIDTPAPGMTPAPLPMHETIAPSTSRWALAALAPLTLFAVVLWQAFVYRGDIAFSWAWAPAVGVEAAFNIDGLALLMLALIGGIGTFVFVYAGGYMAGMPHRGRLFATLMVFMAAMVGTVTADNLILMLVFWEATSLTSFLLVGFKHDYESARKSAQQALIVTAGGGLCLLAGALLLGEIAGTYSISALLAHGATWVGHPTTPVAMLLIGLGALTKSAQLPFHFWLPNAMAAPTPVSAYLHSATMVKLGVYLLARFDPALGEKAWWSQPLVALGALTAFWSMLLALRERDLKRILAWSTVSALGTLVMLIGLPGAAPPGAVAAFLLAHALYKAPLFFVAGNVDHCTGTRNIDRICGLAPHMPWTAAAAALAAASMAGMPFSLGFAAKELIKAAKADSEVWAWVSYSCVGVSMIAVAVAGVAAFRVFWHQRSSTTLPEIHEAAWAMRWPPLIVAALGIVLGLFPGIVAPLLDSAADAMRAAAAIDESMPDLDVSMAGTVVLTLASGLLLYALWDRVHDVMDRALGALEPASMLAWYGRLMAAIPALAAAITRRVQPGGLDATLVFAAATAAMGLALAAWLIDPAPLAGLPLLPEGLGLTVATMLLVMTSALTLLPRSPLLLLLLAGFAGLASAALFLFAGAPDVAFTQFTVEVAYIVVASVLIIRFTRGRVTSSRAGDRRATRALIAITAGLAVAALLAATTAGPQDDALASYFGRVSVPEAHGLNVVNVILVDFRAVDTLGEIAVVAAAALALMPLLRRLFQRRRRPGGAE
ncbi:putative monovalent cation/H+ antiporter subunit A [Silanimonas algicola]